jgi:hypothetical protein
LSDHQIDVGFGVVEVDPDDHFDTILVEDRAAQKFQPTVEWRTEGPDSNARIAPFGPRENSGG